MLRIFKRWLRRSAPVRPFPSDWQDIIDRNVPMARRLPADDQRELERLVMTFLDEKTFEGAGGFVVTDEVRVTIATQACVLLLHRDTDIYPDLETIVVYPSTYVAKTTTRDGAVVIEGEAARLGESWDRGIVVLAWDAVRSGTTNVEDGHNVVIHEFAHQLDSEDGTMDGAPDLGAGARYAAWARVLGAEFTDLVDRVDAGRGVDIDRYGATNPPEFFAVITEMFFEKPAQLKARHPELYSALAEFYQQDPAALPPLPKTSRRERRASRRG